MPTFTWVEDNESRSATIMRIGKKAQSTYIKSWKIFGTTDDTAVHLDVGNTIGAQYRYWQYPGNPNSQLHVDSYTLEYLGDEAWQLKATYIKDGAENDDQSEPLKRTRSFDTTGATTHRTQGIIDGDFTQGELRFGGGAPNMNGAIGVDGDSVEGVDVITPTLTWTETYDVPAAYVTTEYIKALSRLTGTTNDATFRTFPKGEVLFAGATGSHEWDEEKGDGPWSLTYKFIQSPNAGSGQTLPPISIGSITGITKRGHEYLWVRYEPAVDTANSNLLARPKYVYVNRVYRTANFEELGIGTA